MHQHVTDRKPVCDRSFIKPLLSLLFPGPAFHGENATIAKNGTKLGVCSPGGTEVVCQKCGSHLGDYFAAGVQSGYSYYCIDGVCLLPPDSKPGKVCEPSPTAPAPSKADAYMALRHMMREKGVAAMEQHHEH